MPGTIIELQGSRTYSVNVTGGEATFLYYIHGETDETAAYDLVLNEAPAEWFRFTRSDIDMSNRPTLDQWWPVVKYTLPVYQLDSPPSPGGASGNTDPPPSPSSGSPSSSDVLSGISVSIATESQHVYKSIRTISQTGLGGAAPADFKGLIGVTADGKVEGADAMFPVATLQVKKTIPTLTAGYFLDLLYCAGKTNAAQWWIFGQEEGLFVGASGQSKPSGEFEINYEFKYSKTKNNIVIREDGGGITVPVKRGWHYLWVAYRQEKDAAVNAIIERPIAAYVERIYETVNFNWLAI